MFLCKSVSSITSESHGPADCLCDCLPAHESHLTVSEMKWLNAHHHSFHYPVEALLDQYNWRECASRR